MESPQYIEPIMSEGTRDLLMQSKVLNLRYNSHKVLKFGIEESLVTKNDETVKSHIKGFEAYPWFVPDSSLKKQMVHVMGTLVILVKVSKIL